MNESKHNEHLNNECIDLINQMRKVWVRFEHKWWESHDNTSQHVFMICIIFRLIFVMWKLAKRNIELIYNVLEMHNIDLCTYNVDSTSSHWTVWINSMLLVTLPAFYDQQYELNPTVWVNSMLLDDLPTLIWKQYEWKSNSIF